MSTNHREEAELLLSRLDTTMAAALEKDLPIEDQQHAAVLTGILTNRALTHATLARDGEQTTTTADLRDANALLRRRNHAMRELIATHIVDALASKDSGRYRAALRLTRNLHEADASVDDLINERVPADGWAPPSAAECKPGLPGKRYSPPVETALRNLNLAGHVTPADTLAAVIPVIAGHVAEALVDGEDTAVRMWARSIVDELRRVGLDLAGHVERRVEDLRPGVPFSYDRPPGYGDEPPF